MSNSELTSVPRNFKEVKDANFLEFLTKNYPSAIRDVDGVKMIDPVDDSVFYETELDLNGKGIKDLSGIEAFENLEILGVAQNLELTSIPHGISEKLEELDVDNTSVTTLPYSLVKQLKLDVVETVLGVLKNYERIKKLFASLNFPLLFPPAIYSFRIDHNGKERYCGTSHDLKHEAEQDFYCFFENHYEILENYKQELIEKEFEDEEIENKVEGLRLEMAELVYGSEDDYKAFYEKHQDLGDLGDPNYFRDSEGLDNRGLAFNDGKEWNYETSYGRRLENCMDDEIKLIIKESPIDLPCVTF